MHDEEGYTLYPTKPVIDLQRSDCSLDSEVSEHPESRLSEVVALSNVDRHTRQSGRSPGGSGQASLDNIRPRMAMRSAISLHDSGQFVTEEGNQTNFSQLDHSASNVSRTEGFSESMAALSGRAVRVTAGMVSSGYSFSYSSHMASLQPLIVSTFFAKCIVMQDEVNEYAAASAAGQFERFAEDTK
jgi:hypothetical protein